jgi:hypothetical protein
MTFEETQLWTRLSEQGSEYYTQLAEPERESFRRSVKALLQEQRITVEFVKATGETRAMICTLNEQEGAKYIVKENQDSVDTSTKKTPNQDVCVVWDCGQNAWRSFRWDRLKRIDFKIG